MSAVQKVILALTDPSTDACDSFVRWTHERVSGSSLARAEIEVVDPDTHAAHTTKPIRWYAFASLWAPIDVVDDLVARRPPNANWFRVRDRLAFDRSARRDEARPWAGVKKTTPWASVDSVDPALWQARYTNHGVLAAVHHATAVRYRQNIVLSSDVPAIAAVSELWWTNVEDLVERFTASREAQRLVGYDTLGFVDATRAHPVVTRHETLRAAAVTGTGAFLPEDDR